MAALVASKILDCMLGPNHYLVHTLATMCGELPTNTSR
jgi:hypothetical protein